MQPRVIQVGPLAAASVLRAALAQAPRAAGALALNGAGSTAVANSIALSQSISGASAVLLNGALASGSPAVAWLPNPPSGIYITSAGNDSGITFTVRGLDINSVSQSEVLTGANVGVVASTKAYSRITSIATSASTAAAVTVGTNGVATMDTARRIVFSSSGNDSGLSITISGTNWGGTPISEVVTGASGTSAVTQLDYLTVTQVLVSGATAGTISVGTNGVAGSQWLNLDGWALGSAAGQCVVSGTVNYTVQTTNDDPDSYANPVNDDLVTWDSNYAGVINATASTQFALNNPPAWVRLLLNSETGAGFVRLTVIQHGSVTY